MAKGDVTLKFDANTAQYVQQVLALKAANEQAAESATKLGKKVAEAGDHADHFAHKIKHGMGELAGMLALPTTIMGGFELVMKGIEARIALAEERSRHLATRSAKFEGAMFTLGTTGQAREMREQIEGMASKKYGTIAVDAGKAESIFSQIVAGVGTRATPEQHLAATRTALYAIGQGATEAQAVQTGQAMASVQALAPGMGEEQADQVARFLQLNAPSVMQNERAMGAIARSKDPMATARFMAAGYQEFQGARQIKPLSDLVEQGRTTYERILENPESLPPKERAIARAIRAGEKKLRPVEARDAAVATALRGGDDISAAHRMQQTAESAKGHMLEAGASADAIISAEIETYRSRFKEQHPSLPVPPDFMIKADLLTPHGRHTSPSHLANEVLKDIHEQLKELNESAKGIHSNTGGGPTLQNESEGQK